MGWLDILMWLVPPGVLLTWLGGRLNRGKRRVEEAKPRLIGLGNRAPSPSLALELRNEGKGEALDVIFSLDGCTRSSPPLARIPPWSNETTRQLFYDGSPIHSQRLDNVRLYIRYHNIYGLRYETIYRVTQEQRNNGNYTPQIDWESHSFVEPRISSLEYFKLGK